MGHLINPTAMRIGWSANWVDIYYVDYKYYPEFLHLILKLRNYLTYFLSRRRIERRVIFLVILKYKICWCIAFSFICLRCRLESFREEFILHFLKSRGRVR